MLARDRLRLQPCQTPGVITTVLDPTHRRQPLPPPPYILVRVEAEYTKAARLEEVVAWLSTAGTVVSRFSFDRQCCLLIATVGASDKGMQRDLLDAPSDLHAAGTVQQMCQAMIGRPASVTIINAVVQYVSLMEEFLVSERRSAINDLHTAKDALRLAKRDIATLRVVNSRLTNKTAEQEADIATLSEENALVVDKMAVLAGQVAELRAAHFAQSNEFQTQLRLLSARVKHATAAAASSK